jgi:lysine 6-dehydrogenase
MNVLIFGGSGRIGAAVAWDLVKENNVGTVGIITIITKDVVE